MPGMDKTGPHGNGPQGRGMGPCGGGLPGQGRRHNLNHKGGTHWYIPARTFSPDEEVIALERQRDLLQNQLVAITQRLQVLTSKED